MDFLLGKFTKDEFFLKCFSKRLFKEHLWKSAFEIIIHQNQFQPNKIGTNDEK